MEGYAGMSLRPILVEGARQNNLQGVTVLVPVGALTVVTGVAGAGKSSLAFDVLSLRGIGDTSRPSPRMRASS